MLKKIVILLALVAMLLTLASCGKTKILHCDGCGTEVEVKESSNMTEEWIVYCEKCNEQIEKDNPDIFGE